MKLARVVAGDHSTVEVDFSFNECRNVFSIEYIAIISCTITLCSLANRASCKETLRRDVQRWAALEVMMLNQFHGINGECIFQSDRAISIAYVKWMFSVNSCVLAHTRWLPKHVFSENKTIKTRELVRLHLLHSIERIWRKNEINLFPHARQHAAIGATDWHGKKKKFHREHKTDENIIAATASSLEITRNKCKCGIWH